MVLNSNSNNKLDKVKTFNDILKIAIKNPIKWIDEKYGKEIDVSFTTEGGIGYYDFHTFDYVFFSFDGDLYVIPDTHDVIDILAQVDENDLDLKISERFRTMDESIYPEGSKEKWANLVREREEIRPEQERKYWENNQELYEEEYGEKFEDSIYAKKKEEVQKEEAVEIEEPNDNSEDRQIEYEISLLELNVSLLKKQLDVNQKLLELYKQKSTGLKSKNDNSNSMSKEDDMDDDTFYNTHGYSKF